MSITSEVEKIIFDNFCDNKSHTIREIEDFVGNLNIIDKSKLHSVIHNTFTKIRVYPNVENVGHGTYIFTEKRLSYSFLELKFKALEAELLRLNKITLLNNSMEGIQDAKNKIELYERYMKRFEELIHS